MSHSRTAWSRRSFISACSAATLLVAANDSRADRRAPNASLPASLQPLVERKRQAIRAALAEDDIPGGALCLIHQGKAIWLEGFGVTDRASARPVGTQTIFSVQSTSKHFTATAIMMAARRGLLDLDTPITKYLPEFSVHSRFESDPQKKMTLRVLLSHRAGFTHEAPVGNNYYPASPGFDAHVRSISDTWLRYPVGERFSYSNLGVDLAGYILQKAMGMPFAACLKTMIFDPLSMSDTTCDVAVYASRKDRAHGHEKDHDSAPVEIPMLPSAAVYTSARDMASYAMFHLGRGRAGGKQLLDAKGWNEMHSFPEGGLAYGLAVQRERFRYGETVADKYHHNGGGFGFISIFSYYPESGLAWGAFFNKPTQRGFDAFNDELCVDILEGSHGKKRPMHTLGELTTVEIPQEAREKFVGNYLGRGGEVFRIERDAGAVGMRLQDGFRALRFTSPVDAILPDPSGDFAIMHLEPATALRPRFLRCPNGPSFGDLDYNDGPAGAAGPDKKEWSSYVGKYRMLEWGKPLGTLEVHVRNGFLYLDERRLIVEHEPGLFFSADGEALDFRREQPTWFGIPMQRAGGGQSKSVDQQ